MRATAILILACAIASAPARANDSVAEVAIGGLTLTKSDAIRMDSEDLYISRDIVRMKYRFTNTTDLPIDALVAFPLPDIPPDSYFGLTAPPFWRVLNFKTSVDGQPLALKLVEQDVSARLSALHIPLDGKLGLGLGDNDFDEAINRLPEADRNRLAADGLITSEPKSELAGWTQLWTVRMTWTRHQTFPPRKTITVEHEYVPRAGDGAGGPGNFLDPEYRTSEEFSALRRTYCIDDAWLLSFDKKFELEKSKHEYYFAWGTTLGYVLKTGANWKGPIGDFRAVVNKGKPDSLVSFCAEGVKQISPTQFEVRHANFTPTEDLNIFIVDWLPKTGGQP